MLKKNLKKIEEYTLTYVRVRRLKEAGTIVARRKVIKYYWDEVLVRLAEN